MSPVKVNTHESITDLLNERQSTHGSFLDNARFGQAARNLMHSDPNWDKLHDVHKEALEYIMGKISRILAGDPSFDDSWDDIQGFAGLPKKFNHGKDETS